MPTPKVPRKYFTGYNRMSTGTMWGDIKGNQYYFKWMAQLSTFFIIMRGRFSHGFPVIVPVKLMPFRSGVALWPFIFIRRDSVNTRVVNHEMIHVRQQVEGVVIFSYMWYIGEMLIRLLMYRNLKKAYENHSMEREAKCYEEDYTYLEKRLPYAFLKFIKNDHTN